METKDSTLPEWLKLVSIIGSDNESDGDEGSGDDGDDEGDDDGDEEGSEDDSDDGDSENDDSDGEGSGKEEEDPAAPLKSALRKERKAHKQERRLRIAAEKERDEVKARLAAGTEKESEAISDLQKQLEAAQSTSKSLAAKVKDGAIRSAIISEASKQGFIDPEDALSVASEIDVDQDEEDPTDIDIDEASVKTAVKNLATKKRHLVGKVNETSQTKSGSKQPRRKKTKPASEQKKLEELYPALR